MTLNTEQRDHDQEDLYNDAVQSEIASVLGHDGPSYCGQVANRIDKSPQETRWHLTEMVKRGEVSYNFISKRYSV